MHTTLGPTESTFATVITQNISTTVFSEISIINLYPIYFTVISLNGPGYVIPSPGDTVSVSIRDG